jgi:DNA-binding HxlR family transcriptional regulator
LGIHRGTLTYELRGLEADRIIQRAQYMTIRPTVEYSLTTLGRDLRPVFVALARWNQVRGKGETTLETENK